MTKYSSLADEFYINANLNTEIALPAERGTLLHYFEQVKKRFPSMRNFYSREAGEFVLEEDKGEGAYRWTSIEPKRISGGWVNPASLEEAMELHKVIFDLATYSLNVSPLDCKALNLTFGFDYSYQGNHNELLFQALGCSPAFDKALSVGGSRLIANDLSMTVALDDDCRTQFRINVEPRTTAYQVRTGEFGEELISVFLTVRRFGSLDAGENYVDLLTGLHERAVELLDSFVVDSVLLPVQQAIQIK